MLVGVMVTDGGPHTPEKWAQTTTGQIIAVASTTNPAVASEGRKLELRILEILEDAHRKVQEKERGELKKKSHARLNEKLDAVDMLDVPLAAIIAAGKSTQFKDHFEKPETAVAIRNLLGQHFVNSMHIERQWHCDKHMDDPKCRAYKEKYK